MILFTHTKIISIVRQRTTRTTTMTGSARAEVTMRRNKKTTQVTYLTYLTLYLGTLITMKPYRYLINYAKLYLTLLTMKPYRYFID